jgi:pilus assembly protein CpaB
LAETRNKNMSTTLKFALLFIAAAMLALVARALYAGMADRSKPSERLVQVRVAASDLPAGLLLLDDDLVWKSLEPGRVPDGALVKGTKAADNVAGVLVRHDTRAGELMSTRDVIRPDAPGFLAAVLKPGMRAVSVPIDIVSGNAGLIQPGDYVDMILVQEASKRDTQEGERALSVVSETVAEKVRVIAVGSVFQHQPQPDSTKGASKSAPARTVTIEVMPRAAEAVAVAARLGTLSLALRSFAVTDRTIARDEPVQSIVAWDDSSPKSAPVWAGDVSRAIRKPTPAAPAEAEAPAPQLAPREITILRGSRSDKRPVGVVVD